ncbi:MAG: helix-turn-helix domain-containing protein [Thermodesulfobacteriota bacterium]|nr:helix-turn-helix domain-containing protein [Thermodesulfobacteriota bacterium]
MYENNRLLTISEASQRLHLPKHTLRFWEKEFDGLFIPEKTQGGQRRYTHQNIMVIEEIKNLRNKGMSLSDIKRELHHGYRGESSNKIDLLAHRVAEVVKVEVYNFFKE